MLLEVPLSAREARSLSVADDVCRVVVSSRRPNPVGGSCAQVVLEQVCREALPILAIAINASESAGKLAAKVNLAHENVIDETYALRLTEEHEVRAVVPHWNAEMIVCCPIERVQPHEQYLQFLKASPKWWSFASASQQTPFLRAIDRVKWVGFYSRSQTSLELFGKRDAIVSIARGILNYAA